MTVTILKGDCRDVLATLPDESVHCVVTSPPYFGLRDYGVAGQIGLEATPDAFVAELVAVFADVRRVLRDDGTVWLNLGDSYNALGGIHAGREDNQAGVGAGSRTWRQGSARADGVVRSDGMSRRNRDGTHAPGLKPKDLIGIPWRVAFALQADGWYLRQDIIWSKPNSMPESVRDRCTKAHEYIFLLSKSERYYYDGPAIAETSVTAWEIDQAKRQQRVDATGGAISGGTGDTVSAGTTRNKRSVWEVGTHAYSEAHFATFPPALIEPCIKAGCPKGGTVLDPFGGAGTTGLVADRLGRNAILIELNPEYAAMAERRIKSDAGMFAATDLRSPDVKAYRTQKVSEADGPQNFDRNCNG
jgi:DNA modification methylase